MIIRFYNMNNKYYIWHIMVFLAVSLIMTGCGLSYSPSLREADKLLSSNYKQGKAMLDSICQADPNMSTKDKMYSQLLKVKADDLAGRSLKNKKAQIDSIANYFENKELWDDNLTAEALYYAGRLYTELDQHGKALLFFKDANKYVTNDHEELQENIYHQIANLYGFTKSKPSVSHQEKKLLHQYEKKNTELEFAKEEVYRQKMLTYIFALFYGGFCLTIIIIAYFVGRHISNIKQQKKILELKIDKYNDLQLRNQYKPKNETLSEQERIYSSEIYQTIKSKSDEDTGKMSNEEWKEASNLINSVYKNFDQNLHRFLDTSSQEYKICLLVKLGISPTNMAKILNVSREAISASRRRMYIKAFQKKGTPADWDKVILTL